MGVMPVRGLCTLRLGVLEDISQCPSGGFVP
jgi:hypothetical protein